MDEQPGVADQPDGETAGAATALKAHKIGLLPAHEGDYYALTFLNPLNGEQVGAVINTVNTIVPEAYFHFSAAPKGSGPVALHSTMIAFTGGGNATTETVNKLVAAFDPEIRLVGTGVVTPGVRSFEVTFKVLNFDDDTDDGMYRDLINKIEQIACVREVIWDGESEIYLLVSKNDDDTWDELMHDLEGLAGLTFAPVHTHSGSARLTPYYLFLKYPTGNNS